MDVYRPVAQDQLRTLANELGMHFLESNESDPIALASQALEEAKLRGSRWLFIDTAGRLHLDNVMMSQIKDLQKVFDPTEILSSSFVNLNSSIDMAPSDLAAISTNTNFFPTLLTTPVIISPSLSLRFPKSWDRSFSNS